MHRLLPTALALFCVVLPGCGTASEPTRSRWNPSCDGRTLRCAEGSDDGVPTAVVEVLQLRHSRADELAPVLSDLIGSETDVPRVTADQRLNALIVYGEPEDLGRIRQLVALLDTPPGR